MALLILNITLLCLFHYANYDSSKKLNELFDRIDSKMCYITNRLHDDILENLAQRNTWDRWYSSDQLERYVLRYIK